MSAQSEPRAANVGGTAGNPSRPSSGREAFFGKQPAKGTSLTTAECLRPAVEVHDAKST